jgi:hypothetical protein
VNSGESISRKIEWGRWIIAAAGGGLFLLGAGRFVQTHHFDLSDALYCCLAVIPAGLLLLVIAYVVQHAKLAAVVPLGFAGVLVFSSPVFDVAIGLALMGVISETVMSDRKTVQALRRYDDSACGEKKKRKSCPKVTPEK